MDTAIIVIEKLQNHIKQDTAYRKKDRHTNAETVDLLFHFIESSYTVTVAGFLLVNQQINIISVH
jgi:hypothetical protein